jgi:hypothetical protein
MENITAGTVKLLKPLFNVDGNFNRNGTRMRAKFCKNVSNGTDEYSLWISASDRPDKDYTSDEKDQYYWYVLINDWLIGVGTERQLINNVGSPLAGAELFNDQGQGRERSKYFDDIREGKTWPEGNEIINKIIEREKELIEKYGNDSALQANDIKRQLDWRVTLYQNYKKNNGRWPDCVGAAVLGDLGEWLKLAEQARERSRKEDEERAKEARAKLAEEERIKKQEHMKKLDEAEAIFRNGGTIKDCALIVELADKHGIKIPIRTRGWMLDTLYDVTIGEGVSCRYLKKKGGKGSQSIWDVLNGLRDTIRAEAVA